MVRNRHDAKRRGRTGWFAAIVLLAGLTVWTAMRVPSSDEAVAQTAVQSHPVSAPAPVRAQGDRAPSAQTAVINHCPPTATACVDEQLRLSWLQQDGKISYGPIPVMPGSAGAADAVATPKGLFHVQYKDAHHVSSEYNEQMPNAVFFAAGGIAFHQGSLISASHGCVHLSPADSAHYYQSLHVGATVAVF